MKLTICVQVSMSLLHCRREPEYQGREKCQKSSWLTLLQRIHGSLSLQNEKINCNILVKLQNVAISATVN
jgi:hypothetical protein